MKKIIHKAVDRAYRDREWLKTYFSFSFADYYNVKMMGFGALRVLNDDVIAPGEGFDMHPHDNFEIMTVILSGALLHKDSEGNESVIKKGGVQLISAGSGISHSEFNASESEEVSLLQIWIEPNASNAKPRYQEGSFFIGDLQEKIIPVAIPKTNGKELEIKQDAYISLVSLEKGTDFSYGLKRKRNGVYIFVIEGKILAEGAVLGRRDAIGIWETDKLKIKTQKDTRLIILEVPM